MSYRVFSTLVGVVATAVVLGVLYLVTEAYGEPAPEAPVCRFLASADDATEVWRCSGAGFEASCYVSVSTGGMSKGASSIDCGGR